MMALSDSASRLKSRFVTPVQFWRMRTWATISTGTAIRRHAPADDYPGAIQDKKTERCTGFRSVRNADPVFKKIKDIAAEHIQKRLAIEPVLRTTRAPSDKIGRSLGAPAGKLAAVKLVHE